MKVLFGALYFVALGLLVFGDGSRDTVIAGLFIADSILQLADVLSTIAIGVSEEGIKIRRIRNKTDDLDTEEIYKGVQAASNDKWLKTWEDIQQYKKEEEE